ncbi:MAG: hypothetical protein EBQ78_05335 [Betaproteobacteria bacterium]|nr:hypothetical protein [Betaproteobacteria bacterium]
MRIPRGQPVQVFRRRLAACRRCRRRLAGHDLLGQRARPPASSRWSAAVPIADFLNRIKANPPHRIDGTAIFMVPHQGIAPRSLEHNLKHNKVLHQRVVLMSLESVHTPYVDEQDRFEVKHLDCDVHSVHARYGYMEEPNVMRAVAMLRAREFHHLHLAEISFFVGKEKFLPRIRQAS